MTQGSSSYGDFSGDHRRSHDRVPGQGTGIPLWGCFGNHCRGCSSPAIPSIFMDKDYRIIGTFKDGDMLAIVERVQPGRDVPEWLSHNPEFLVSLGKFEPING